MVAALRVLVAGGGVAGLETLLALKTLAQERVDVDVIAPETEFVLRADAPWSALTGQPPVRHHLAPVVAGGGGRFLRDRVEAVNGDEHRVRLASGRHRAYDALVLSVGAPPPPPSPAPSPSTTAATRPEYEPPWTTSCTGAPARWPSPRPPAASGRCPSTNSR